MAFVQLIPRTNFAAGTHVSGAQQLAPGTTQVSVRIDGNWQPSDGACTVGVESSVDGNDPWEHVISAVCNGGGRGKNGELPTVGWTDMDTALFYRGFITLTNRTVIGMTIEIT